MLFMEFLLKVLVCFVCYGIGRAFDETSTDSFSTGWFSGIAAFACMDILDALIFSI